MTPSLLVSVAAALVTVAAVSLRAAVVAAGMMRKAERPEDGRDIRTW